MPAVAHSSFFFFHDTATTEIYTLSLHDALPISIADSRFAGIDDSWIGKPDGYVESRWPILLEVAWFLDPEERIVRSEEHTSELQSRRDLVCRLLLEKKKKQMTTS